MVEYVFSYLPHECKEETQRSELKRSGRALCEHLEGWLSRSLLAIFPCVQFRKDNLPGMAGNVWKKGMPVEYPVYPFSQNNLRKHCA